MPNICNTFIHSGVTMPMCAVDHNRAESIIPEDRLDRVYSDLVPHTALNMDLETLEKNGRA